MKKNNAPPPPPKKAGRPKGDPKENKIKETFTLSPRTSAAVEKESKRLGISKSQLVDHCVLCKLLGECDTFTSINNNKL